MKNKLTRLSSLIPLLIFCMLAVYLWKGLALNPRELPSTLIDKPAPVFQAAALLDPAQTITQEIFLGNITLFHVWATWCSVCKAEHEYLVDLAKNERVRLIGLNYKDRRKDALVWLKKGNPYVEVVYDGAGKVGMDWGVYGTPETFVIDQQGIIRYKYTGMLNERVWQNNVLPLIKKLQMTDDSSLGDKNAILR